MKYFPITIKLSFWSCSFVYVDDPEKYTSKMWWTKKVTYHHTWCSCMLLFSSGVKYDGAWENSDEST